MSRLSLLVAVLLLSIGVETVAQEKSDSKKSSLIGKQIADFELKDEAGKLWKSSDLNRSGHLVVVFLGTECPLVKLYAARLEKIYQANKEHGFQVVGINSNQQDSLTEISHFVRKNKLSFPMLKDPGNKVADAFGAERTPEVFVLDSKSKVVYHGAIDDQYTYGLQKAKVRHEYLKDAIADIRADREIKKAETEVVGCYIGKLFNRKSTGNVTYANQISRILQNNCVSCHRKGEIGPFALTDYDEVVGWAEMIKEVIEQQRMPPWHANPKHGDFKNDARLTEAEKNLIYQWVKDGAPLGDKSKLPKPKKFATGWQIGKPDLVLKMRSRPYRVPARGTVPYRYFVVDPGFQEDKWIRAAEARAGNRAVVHHIIVAAMKGRGNQRSIHGNLESEFLTATAPGAPPLVLPDGYAKRIPAGHRIVFQLHYTPNGTAAKDISEVGFIFADPKEVKKEVLTQMAINTDFRIPAGAENYSVKARHRFRQKTELLSLFPHMHLRGKSFRYTLELPDGEKKILLDVPKYDFNWQNGYAFTKPVIVPKGSILRCQAHFDNSEKNLANPDPTKRVRWGDQTWEEMMIGYFDMALVDQDLTKEK